MTNLKQVISSVLRDVIQAQHEAASYARELAKSHQQITGGISISPAATVGELTLNLRYAIQDGEDITEVKVLNANESDRLLGNISEQLAKLVIRKLVHQTQASGVPYTSNGFSYIDDLGDNRRLIDYIAHRMLTRLKAHVDKLYNEQHEFEVEPIADQVLAVGEEALLRHSDIEGLFALAGGADLLAETRRVLDDEVSEEIRKIIQEEQSAELFSSRTERSLRIEIDAERLKDYPPEAIQSITLKVVPPQLSTTNV
ncbi:MAG: hypothetical protein Q4A64_02330 [Porphyromonadaceae bacterium]|nr:hypothetical protein [Porphyromonadaceae bacterium]